MEDRGKFKGIDEWSEFNGLSFTAEERKNFAWQNYIQKNGKFKKNISSSSALTNSWTL